MGGHWFNDLFGGAHSLTEDRIEAIARETIADHLGIQAKPTRCLVRILKVRERADHMVIRLSAP